MPASRWNSNILDILSLFDQDELALEELLFKPIIPQLVQENKENEPAKDNEELSSQIPTVLPILPLRGLVVYPQTVVPLTVGQPRSIHLVDDVVASEDRLIGLIASRNPEVELAEPKDLYEVGTVAIVHRLFRAPDNTIRWLCRE
jgi:ATP-dependent Lon protease